MNFRHLIPTLFAVLSLITTNLFAQQTDTLTDDSSNSQIVRSEPGIPGNYVLFQKDTLFEIRANLGPYTPEERAREISKRLETLVDEEKNINIDSFRISEKNNYTIISYKNKALLSVGDADVGYLEKSRQEIVEEYLETIKSRFGAIVEEKSLMGWLLNIGYTLLALFGLIIIFYLQKKLFKWIDHKLVHYEKKLKGKGKNMLKYLLPKESSNIFLVVSKIVRFTLTIVILFFYLPFMFSFLPWTRDLAEKFYGYIASPLTKLATDFVNFIPNIISIIIIIYLARYFLRILTYISKEIEQGKLKIKGFHNDWAKPTFNLVKIVIYALALVFIAQYLPSSKAFQGVSIFVGVIFTLGSTGAIANMIAGIVITYMRPFLIGDRVKIGDTVGDVIEKNLLVTRIRTPKNENITIPNSTIINTNLLNYSKNASDIGIILYTSVTIGYDVPAEQVIQLLLNAAANTKDLSREFKPFVLQKSLNDFYIEYELNVYTKQPKKMPLLYSELHQSILAAFNAAGVEILSPHYNAYRDGNESTIPQEPKPPKNPVDNVIDKITGKKT